MPLWAKRNFFLLSGARSNEPSADQPVSRMFSKGDKLSGHGPDNKIACWKTGYEEAAKDDGSVAFIAVAREKK
jgi:hypothetical protein